MPSAKPKTILARVAMRDPLLADAIWLALLFNAFTLVVFTVSSIFRDDLGNALIIGPPMMLVDGLIGFSLFYVLRWTSSIPSVRRWVIVGAAVVAVALAQAAWDTQLRMWVGTVLTHAASPYLAYVRAATLNVYNAGMFAALLAFQAANSQMRKQQKMLDASRESERDAHMLALRFQLNPHFLFNTLNAISSLVIIGRAREANSMIDRLSSFLRSSLTADPNSLVTVEEEFEMLDSYLEIESVRFGDRLLVAIDLPPHLSGALMPPFLLQPLVENAIKYAVAPAKRPIQIIMAAEEKEGQLVLTIADDGDGCADVVPGTGVGLANVRERLRLNYGDSARLEKHEGVSGCRVQITMPLKLGNDAAPARDQTPAFA